MLRLLLHVKLICLFLAPLAPAADLHDAVNPCQEARVRQILAQHAPLNTWNSDGLTPLNAAIDAGQLPCVRLLLEAGADRQVRDRQGRTALEAADQFADRQVRGILRLYLHTVRPPSGEAVPEAARPINWSLEEAVRRRQPEVLKMFLSLGADPNQLGQKGTTPLSDAALSGDLPTVRVLLERGARPHLASQSGIYPLHDAALGDHADVVRALAQAGADLNVRGGDEAQTPLHFAAVMGKLRALEALIALGADLQAKDRQGQTPLAAARRAGLTDAVALLDRASRK